MISEAACRAGISEVISVAACRAGISEAQSVAACQAAQMAQQEVALVVVAGQALASSLGLSNDLAAAVEEAGWACTYQLVEEVGVGAEHPCLRP